MTDRTRSPASRGAQRSATNNIVAVSDPAMGVPVTTDPESLPKQPFGREEVKEAILKAATDLFARLPWSAVTLRGIAAEAGVNYGLVHRHFRTRDEVVKAVFQRAAESNEPVLESDDFATALSIVFLKGTAGIAQVIASAMLAGVDPHSLHDSFPSTRRLAELAATTVPHVVRIDGQPIDPRVVGAAFLAAALGWRVFEPFLVASFGMQDLPTEDLPDQVLATLRLLLQRIAEDLPSQTGGRTTAKRPRRTPVLPDS